MPDNTFLQPDSHLELPTWEAAVNRKRLSSAFEMTLRHQDYYFLYDYHVRDCYYLDENNEPLKTLQN